MIIAPRFNGPPRSGNGGYSAGLLAAQLPAGTGAEVTLLQPPPLATELAVDRVGDTVTARDGDTPIARARPVDVPDDLAVPAVSLDEAATASRGYRGLVDHPFGSCFVCGPARAAGDGLRVFPGPLPDGRTAAPFTTPADMDAVLTWAVLDCPGGWTIALTSRLYVLGRMSARVLDVPAAGETCVVVGQLDREEGRKAWVRSTLYGADGRLCALGRATWIAVPELS